MFKTEIKVFSTDSVAIPTRTSHRKNTQSTTHILATYLPFLARASAIWLEKSIEAHLPVTVLNVT